MDPRTGPVSRHAHTSSTGQSRQRGARAVHTTAPSSMNATEARAAVAGSSGSRDSISARSAAVVVVPASGAPVTARATTRRTLVSTTGWRCPYANAATARAV